MLKNKWIRLRDANISEAQLNDLANAVIDTDDMNGLEALRPPDFSGSALTQELNIKQDIEDSTGASKLLSGTPSGSSLDRTAAGIATVVQGGLERFELVVTTLEEELLKPLIRKIWMLNQQFLPEGRDTEVTQDKFVRVNPSEIQFNNDVSFVGIKELGEKEFKINALNILLQNVDKYVQFGIDPIPVLFKLVKLLGFGELKDDIDKRPENQLEQTPEGEVQLLRLGRQVRIDLNDNHEVFIAAYEQLLQENDLPENVRANTIEALGQRLAAIQIVNQSSEREQNVEKPRGNI